MGASGWRYKVPYDPDVAGALARLRDEEFAAGRYQKPTDAFAGYPLAAVAEELREEAEAVGEPIDEASLARLAAGEDPVSIDEALTWAAESGTHSILDIVRGVGDEPDFGVVTALPADRGEELFGTARPTEAQVEAALDRIDVLLRSRWEGVYVVGYTDGAPSALYFVGVSGD